MEKRKARRQRYSLDKEIAYTETEDTVLRWGRDGVGVLQVDTLTALSPIPSPPPQSTTTLLLPTTTATYQCSLPPPLLPLPLLRGYSPPQLPKHFPQLITTTTNITLHITNISPPINYQMEGKVHAHVPHLAPTIRHQMSPQATTHTTNLSQLASIHSFTTTINTRTTTYLSMAFKTVWRSS